MINELNEKNFEENIKEGLKFVAFTAPWCGYCQKQKPILEEISKNNIWVGSINADNNPHLTLEYDIHAFPSFILFKNGKQITKFSGYKPKYDLMNILLEHIKK